VCLSVSWLHFLVGNKKVGSILTLTAGILKLSTIALFFVSSYKTNWKIFVGHQTLHFNYSLLSIWVLPLLGVINIIAGILLLVTEELFRTHTLFHKNEVRFVSPVSLRSQDVGTTRTERLSAKNKHTDVRSYFKYPSASHNATVTDRVQKRFTDFKLDFVKNTKNRLTSVFDQHITRYVYFNSNSTTSIVSQS
ncbi:hypothetical protein ACHWQZ_G000961, partial [Mnemiopsis leidyi]